LENSGKAGSIHLDRGGASLTDEVVPCCVMNDDEQGKTTQMPQKKRHQRRTLNRYLVNVDKFVILSA